MGSSILVIDDDPDICELVSMTLSKKGFAVRSAMSGEQGIGMARESLPDIVLLDNTLPDMDGKDVALKIKGMNGRGNVIIVMMTGKESPRDELDTTTYSGCLKKPFRLSDMADFVEKVLKAPDVPFNIPGTDHYYCAG
jgi:DNA-binding response OmpR family regulator